MLSVFTFSSALSFISFLYHIRSASTAWDCAGLQCNPCNRSCRARYAGPKHCHYSQTSRSQSPLNPFCTWYLLLTGLHHSSVVSIPLLLPSNSSYSRLFFPLMGTTVMVNYYYHPPSPGFPYILLWFPCPIFLVVMEQHMCGH